MQIGIVGLPNVGKSTLFKALTKKAVDASNYPFCTIDPNVGVVPVPDARLNELSKISNSAQTIPTAIEFVDIAGLVKNAHKGEGLGNQFLSHIRSVDAIVEVLRNFENSDITHVEGSIDPLRDKSIIQLELVMADMDTVDKHLVNTQKQAKSGDKQMQKKAEILQKILKHLEDGQLVNTLELTTEEQELIKDVDTLTSKPIIYVENIDENFSQKQDKKIYINAKLEAELAELDDKEKKEYMQELGLQQTGLEQLIRSSYQMLNLISFFTSGEKESRAWTVKQGAKAPKAAGRIHTDFEKGFIRAEVVDYQKFIQNNGWLGAKEAGVARLEGKDYVVQDGDVIYFKTST